MNIEDWEPVDINAPWGKYENLSPLGFVKQCIDQIQFLIDSEVCPNIERAKADIEGYREVVSSDKEENAYLFLRFKRFLRENNTGVKIGSNRDIVEEMKDKGMWR